VKKDDIFQTKEVQAQLCSGKSAFEPVVVFTRGTQGSKRLVARMLQQLSQVWHLGKA